jgi:hypothetical protein
LKGLLVAAVLLAGCSRAPAPRADGAVEYSAPDGSFTALLPGGWKVDESPTESKRVAFFGPPDGATPFSDMIRVVYYPSNGRFKNADEYLANESLVGLAEPTHAATVAGLPAVERIVRSMSPGVHRAPQPLINRMLAVTVPGGFFALEHTYPESSKPSPAFEALLASFKPRAAK